MTKHPEIVLNELWEQITDANMTGNEWKDNVPVWVLRDAFELLVQKGVKVEMTNNERDFFDWLACSVVLADDFETNPEFYREVICRKLVRLGILKLENEHYILPEPSKEMSEDE